MKKFTLTMIVALIAVVSYGQTRKSLPEQALLQKGITEQKARGMVKHTNGQTIGVKGSALRNNNPVRKIAGKTQTRRGIGAVNAASTPQRLPEGVCIISEQPEGTLQTYSRDGFYYYLGTNSYVYYDVQAGLIDIVTADDGRTVWLKAPVCGTASMGTWVEGELSADGTTITVPTGQYLWYFDDYGYGLRLQRMTYDEASDDFVIDETAVAISYTIDGDEIRLNGTDEDHILGLAYDDDDSWSGFGDYESVYKPFTDEPNEFPWIETTQYVMTGVDGNGNNVKYKTELGIDGTEAWLKGFNKYLPGAWVKGTVEGDRIVFPSGQYLGILKDNPMYLVGADRTEEISDIVFTYDSESEKWSSDNFLVISARPDYLSVYDYYSGVSLEKLPDIAYSTEVIEEQPEGELKIYSRSGVNYIYAWGFQIEMLQNGIVMYVVYAPDGKTVYMKDPVTQGSTATWVKGTIEGDKIHVPLYQPVFYYDETYGAITAMIDVTQQYDEYTGELGNQFMIDPTATEVTFTINEADGTISIDGTSANKVYGLVYLGDYSWAGMADYGSVYTPFDEEIVTMPENVDVQDWAFQWNEYGYTYGRLLQAAIDGDRMYIGGLSEMVPEAVIEGKIADGRVTFPSDQFVGITPLDVISYIAGTTYTVTTAYDPDNEDYYDVFNYTYTPELSFTYDADKRILRSDDNVAMLLNGGKCSEAPNDYGAFFSPMFNYHENVAAVPADPEFTEYDDSYFDWYNYWWIGLYIKTQDTNDRFIDPENMAYQLFYKLDDIVESYIFYTDEYMNLDEDMEIIPYNFTDGDEDILLGGSTIYLYQIGFDDIGIQAINNTDGKECRSNRVWYYGGVEEGTATFDGEPVGISDSVSAEKKVTGISYYDLSGVKASAPRKGINLKVVTYSDGTRKTVKMVGK